MPERRGKRSTSTKEESSSSSPSSSSSSSIWSPAEAAGMTKAQFCSIICISLAVTNWVDINRSLGDGLETTYCSRHFKYNVDDISDASALGSEDDTGSQESVLQCTESDLGIITIKAHITILRITLSLLISLMCWSNEGMLRSWNYAYTLCPLLSQLVVSQAVDICRTSLYSNELRTTLALVSLSLASNYEGRQGRMPMNVKEGMYNIILYALTIFGSYLVSSHLIEGVQGYTSFDDVTAGGEALWIMTMVTEYAMIMFTITFGLFFFDNARKKLLLFFLAAIFLVHALYHLPMEKDMWVDAPTRQSITMGIFVSCMVGVLFPSFADIKIKK